MASYGLFRNFFKLNEEQIDTSLLRFSFLLYIPLFYTMRNLPGQPKYLEFFLLFLLSITAFILEQQTHSYEILSKKYIASYDATRERNLRLKAKNDALIARQDYEISLATMKERNRIARDIHDNVGHLLTRSILITGAVKTVNTNENLAPTIESLDETLNNAMTTIRKSVHDLHTQAIDLQDAISTLVRDFSFCPVEFTYQVTSELPCEICYSFISVIKEALTNPAKHSNATNMTIKIHEHPALYQLIVEDNGTSISGAITDGIGLENMQERVRQLHGIFHIQTEHGFRIFITVPKNK
jgi:signal transduction histidine kinase